MLRHQTKTRTLRRTGIAPAFKGQAPDRSDMSRPGKVRLGIPAAGAHAQTCLQTRLCVADGHVVSAGHYTRRTHDATSPTFMKSTRHATHPPPRRMQSHEETRMVPKHSCDISNTDIRYTHDQNLRGQIHASPVQRRSCAKVREQPGASSHNCTPPPHSTFCACRPATD